MKNVTGMYVQQTRLFAPDVVPYRLVTTAKGMDRMKEVLGFNNTNWQENLEFAFQGGTIEYQGMIVPLTWVSFHDRRIIVQVLGDSGAAHAAYAAIDEVLAELAPGFRGAIPLWASDETTCIAQLDFDWTALFNPAFVDYVSRRVREFSSAEVERFIRGVNVRFTLGIEKKSKELSEHGVTLFDQSLIVEPRADTPLSDRIYHTYSPSDSDTHLRLVAELEKNLSGLGRGGRSRRTTRTKKKP